jgi:2-dehydropantoate 2-reductase
MVRILIFGAGPLGSLFAARLHQGGQDVTLLARNQRYMDLQKHGIVLKNWYSDEEEIIKINLIEKLLPDNCYDLVLVIMRKNSALKILPILEKNCSTKILFLMNNAAGPSALVDVLGDERVLVGFPGAAGYKEGHKIVYINAEEGQPAVINVGSPDGGVDEGLTGVAAELEKGRFLKTEIQENMDAWSKYHVGLLFPSLAPAAYLCDFDRLRMSNTRDAVVLAVRAMKEGFKVLQTLGYPITPRKFRNFLFIPEPILVSFVRNLIKKPAMDIAMMRHARVIRDEIQQLNEEFMHLVELSGLFTPNIRFLVGEFNRRAPSLPEGSRSIRLDWTVIMLIISAIIITGLFVGFLLN